MEQAIGWGVREGCGGGRVGVNELHGGCSSCMEGSEVIKKEVQGGSHGLIVQMVEVHHIFYVVLLDGDLERDGEEQD